MLKTRSRKILGDVLARKGRTLLVSLSIMIGVFGVSTLVGVGDLLVGQLQTDLKVNEIAHNHVYLASTGGQISLEENAAYLEKLRLLPGVTDVEGQAFYLVDWRKADDPSSEGTFASGNLLSYTEPLDQVAMEPIARLIDGRYPEKSGEIVVEKRFGDTHDVALGDKLVFRALGNETGVSSEYEVVGFVYHPYFTITPAVNDNLKPEDNMYAYYDDAQEIVGFSGLSSFYVRYTDYEVAKERQSELFQAIGQETPYIPVFNFLDDPEDNLILRQVRQVSGVLALLAMVAMVVSGFLVTNVINTVVVEQKRQIGVMKSLGASYWDNVYMYAGMALVYGAIGTALGLLLSIPATYFMASGLATLALTIIDTFRISAMGIGVGLAMGLLVPVLAAMIPVFLGTRVSVLEAMTDLGIASNWGKTRLSRWIGGLPVPVNMRQALSNVVQKRGRLALTGFTLMLAAAAFMGVTAVFSVLTDDIESMFDTFNYEIGITPQSAQDYETTRNLIMTNVEGIEEVYPGYNTSVSLEGYSSTNQLAEGTDQVFAYGIAPDSPVIHFDLEEGTGWNEDPTRQGIILTHLVAESLGKSVGDTVVITAQGTAHEYEIIGIDGYPEALVYLDWRELATIAGYVNSETGEPMPGSFLLNLSGEPDAKKVDTIISDLTALMLDNGVQASYANMPEASDLFVQQFNLFGMIFNLTSAVMAAVGAIGLLATLSMSVFERQKEIGVMRSIGAGSATIITQFLTEGVLVGMIAWAIAIPVSILLGMGLVESLPFGEAFRFAYPPSVVVTGFVGIIAIAMIASIWPSLTAARKTVSDILRYQ